MIVDEVTKRAALALARNEGYPAHDATPAFAKPNSEIEWERFVPTVRTVMEAIREPSDRMRDAAEKVEVDFQTHLGPMRGKTDGDHIFQAMIDAALEE